jgi:DNA invertase Pin-like site-specific DNA recombinase
MNLRQKMMEEVVEANRKIIELQDMLKGQVSEFERRLIRRKINVLSDIVFYNQEMIED